jgi:hypothetical protein
VSAHEHTLPAAAAPQVVGAYRLLLGWAFALFSAVRLLSYLPTMWAIQTSSASDQHSLFTWLTWLGANITMGLVVGEQAQRRFGGCALVCFANALMCGATALMIVIHR